MLSAPNSLRLLSCWTVLIAGTQLSACAGGQSGGEDAVPPSMSPSLPFPASSSDNGCQLDAAATALASIDEMSPAGFSAASVLRYAEGTFHAPLHFDRQPTDGRGGWDARIRLSIEPGGDEPLEIQIRHAGEVRYFAGHGTCNGELDIDVRVTLRSPSGAFDETVDGVLMASSAFEAQLVLRFHTASVNPYEQPVAEDEPVVPVHPLAGALEVTATDHGGRYELAFLELVFSFSQLGLNGYADGWMYGVDDHTLRLVDSLATIGNACDGRYGFALGPDDAPVPGVMAPSAKEVLARLGDMHIDAVRDDGSRSPFSLDLEYTADSACSMPGDSDSPLEFEAMLSIAADLDDARVDGRWPVELRAHSTSDGALASVSMNLAQGSAVSIEHSEIERLKGDWGVTGLEIDAYDQISITFELMLEPGTKPPGAAGELFIRGYALPPDGGMPLSLEDGDVLGHLSFEAAPSH